SENGPQLRPVNSRFSVTEVRDETEVVMPDTCLSLRAGWLSPRRPAIREVRQAGRGGEARRWVLRRTPPRRQRRRSRPARRRRGRPCAGPSLSEGEAVSGVSRGADAAGCAVGVGPAAGARGGGGYATDFARV